MDAFHSLFPPSECLILRRILLKISGPYLALPQPSRLGEIPLSLGSHPKMGKLGSPWIVGRSVWTQAVKLEVARDASQYRRKGYT